MPPWNGDTPLLQGGLQAAAGMVRLMVLALRCWASRGEMSQPMQPSLMGSAGRRAVGLRWTCGYGWYLRTQVTYAVFGSDETNTSSVRTRTRPAATFKLKSPVGRAAQLALCSGDTDRQERITIAAWDDQPERSPRWHAPRRRESRAHGHHTSHTRRSRGVRGAVRLSRGRRELGARQREARARARAEWGVGGVLERIRVEHEGHGWPPNRAAFLGHRL